MKNKSVKELNEMLEKEEKTLDMALSNDLEELARQAQEKMKAIKNELSTRQQVV